MGGVVRPRAGGYHLGEPVQQVPKHKVNNIVADPGCLSRIPGPSRLPDPGSKSFRIGIKEVCLTHKFVSKLSEILSGMFIPDPDLDFLPIPYPGVKKAPDPGSGSATLVNNLKGNCSFIILIGPQFRAENCYKASIVLGPHSLCLGYKYMCKTAEQLP